MSPDEIVELLKRHYWEASGGLVQKPPSKLTRGEGTEKSYYIMKIDLVGSTEKLQKRHKSTYLKLAHTFLSSVDKITQDLGADPDQAEYAGDSVIAYFEKGKVGAESAVFAACYSQVAVRNIRGLDTTLATLNLHSKIVLHADTLIVANIGPRANSFLTAIGHPLHRVAKIEKGISAGVVWATPEFHREIAMVIRKYFIPEYSGSAAANLGLGSLSTVLSMPSYYQGTLDGYKLNWKQLFHDLQK